MNWTRREFLGSAAAACVAAAARAQSENRGLTPPRIIYYNNFASHLLCAYNPNMYYPELPYRWSDEDWRRLVDMIAGFGFNVFEIIPDWGSYDVVRLPRAEYHQRMRAFGDRLEDAKSAVQSGAVLFPDPERYRQELVFFARLFADLTAPHPDYDALKKAYWDRVYRIYDRLPNHVDPRPRGNTDRFVRHFRDWTG